MVTTIDGMVPDPSLITDEVKRHDMQQALNYMGLHANTPIQQITLDKILLALAQIHALKICGQLHKLLKENVLHRPLGRRWLCPVQVWSRNKLNKKDWIGFSGGWV